MFKIFNSSITDFFNAFFNIESYEVRLKIFKSIYISFFSDDIDNRDLIFITEINKESYLINKYQKLAEDDFKYFDIGYHYIKKESFYFQLIYLLFFKSFVIKFCEDIRKVRKIWMKIDFKKLKKQSTSRVYKLLILASIFLSKRVNLHRTLKGININYLKDRRVLFRQLFSFLFKNLDDYLDTLIIQNVQFVVSKKKPLVLIFNNSVYEKKYFRQN